MQTFQDMLIEKCVLTGEQLERAAALAAASGAPLLTVLVDHGFAPEEVVLEHAAKYYGLEFVSLEGLPVQESAVQAVSANLASHYGIMPLRLSQGVLTIAVPDPLDTSAVQDIETNLHYRVERVVARRSEIAEALRRHFGVGAGTVERILADSSARTEVRPEDPSYDLRKMAEDASVVGLVNQLLEQAIADRATDLHFEVFRDGVRLRRRIDGVLYETSVPKSMHLLYPAIVSRIKLMSALNIVERRLPQDGRARVRIACGQYDLRISVIPTVHGEDVVVRILPATMVFDIASLGFSERQLGMLKQLVDKPHGIIFVTGPTGSGKTTTLYACLSRLNTVGVKIITIEDPVEYELRGISQTQVNPKIGLTFAAALRSMLRHDPDIMMVGEVRDRETAEIAIQTAMTGHLVLSTLHTNDAASGSVRLLDMGLAPYLITSTVLAFIAQRLVRVICGNCRDSYQSEGKTLYRGMGCRLCGKSGYRGRIAIAEFLSLQPPIQELILKKASAQAIRAKADELGMETLVQDGWAKAAQGITTPEEVLRVTSLM